MNENDCACMDPQAGFREFTASHLGVDDAGGRYAEVSLWECRHCGAKWLHYRVEYEGFERSGRWYRGLLSEAQAHGVTAADARSVLEGLGWHFCGGSYFGTPGRQGAGPMDVDL